MGTLITIQIAGSGPEASAAIGRAFGWFHQIEDHCSRFRQHSELMQLCTQTGVPVPATAILYEAVQFALMVARESGGAFDPTVGRQMEASGFNREHHTGEIVDTRGTADACAIKASYRDVEMDPERKTILLRRPLTLDLGAVAKGLAVDAAARELEPFRDFAIDAGGDLYLGGSNEQGLPWSVGIRHPRHEDALITTLRVSNQAVCTSGDYERRGASAAAHHILDPRTGSSAHAVASATVVAPGAMLADALATAAFVLGPQDGILLLERLGVEGLIVTTDAECHQTRGVPHAA
jgi:thiamine biosynthesis lipoprotein